MSNNNNHLSGLGVSRRKQPEKQFFHSSAPTKRKS